ncbi:sensor histidine kinase [Constantimarinum furrinae]|uniref:histidine kinase n=1 Tax=Constantimarinum furrinae TaxID=2562285 RepID=A0A7G8PWC0_9FLAO|nr:GAF domain-containing sensor histidine kinase [Constantimarinum furrinae]QNJ98636.1 Sensor histidine kinase [Constantimarinum furrinae]
MISPNLPHNEVRRLAEVKKYKLLDTPPEEDYDNITTLLATICDTPIALITLLDKDRNYLKSRYGVTISESPRELSFCGHAIYEDTDLFIVEDARKDIRFKDNPLIKEHGTVFYAGAPLINSNGYALGSLCIYDVKPRVLSTIQKNALLLLSKQVIKLFELHRTNDSLHEMQEQMAMRNRNLNSFANVVSHDLKSPLANITMLSRLIRDENKENLNQEALSNFDLIEESSETLKNYINGILKFYKSEELLEEQNEDVSIYEICSEVKEMLILNDKEFSFPKYGMLLNVNKPAVTQIILNLVDNAFKYNDIEKLHVDVSFSEDEDFYTISIEDNGIGIEKSVQEEIFDMFKTTGIKDKDGNFGTGIGLATVQQLVKKLGGRIRVNSDLGKGSCFTFSIKK